MDKKAEDSAKFIDTAQVRARTHLWMVWAEIAIEQEYMAKQARIQTERERERSVGLYKELKASMVVVSSAAHAIDAVYGAVKDFIPIPPATLKSWENNGTRRHKRISETFKRGFVIGKVATHWLGEFEWLFDLRDSAVHFREENRPLSTHPIGTDTAPEHVSYSVEASGRAVDLVIEVIDTCSRSPRRTLPDLAGWCGGHRYLAQYLVDKRSSMQ